jgi:hypothetical protein
VVVYKEVEVNRYGIKRKSYDGYIHKHKQFEEAVFVFQKKEQNTKFTHQFLKGDWYIAYIAYLSFKSDLKNSWYCNKLHSKQGLKHSS